MRRWGNRETVLRKEITAAENVRMPEMSTRDGEVRTGWRTWFAVKIWLNGSWRPMAEKMERCMIRAHRSQRRECKKLKRRNLPMRMRPSKNKPTTTILQNKEVSWPRSQCAIWQIGQNTRKQITAHSGQTHAREAESFSRLCGILWVRQKAVGCIIWRFWNSPG